MVGRIKSVLEAHWWRPLVKIIIISQISFLILPLIFWVVLKKNDFFLGVGIIFFII